MPPPPGTKQSVWDSTPTLFQLLETEPEQLEARANTYPSEMKGKKRDVAEEKGEKLGANPSSASLNWKHETNGGAAQRGPGPEFIVWWDDPDDQDPESPMNWSSTKKWVNILVISIISFLVWVECMPTGSLL